MSLGRVVNRVLSPLGVAVQRPAGTQRASAEGALERAAALGLAPRTAIDVGAAYGEWTEVASRLFPSARFILVEPLAEFSPFLESRIREFPGAAVVAEAAGPVAGRATLHVHDDLVGTSLHEEPGLHAADRVVPVATIDEIVARERASGPFVVKLDVQGAELDVLRGAASTLRETSLVQLESTLFPFYAGSSDFAEVVAFMRRAGFVVYDVIDLGYRPLDGALAQVDLVFVPESSELRKHREYSDADQRRAGDESLRALYERRLAELRR